jgi:hypothetical protein
VIHKRNFTMPELVEYGRLEEIVLGPGDNPCQGTPQGDPPAHAKQGLNFDCIRIGSTS